MARDASVGRQFSVDKVVTLAYRMAGMIGEHQTLSEQQASEGRDFLELILDNLQNKGLLAQESSFVTVSVVSGTQTYTLPADVLDVEGDGFLGDANLLVSRVGAQGWHESVDVDQTGVPTQLYVHRTGDALQVKLAPIPGDNDTLRLLCRRVLSDCRDGAATLDFGLGFTLYLVTALQGMVLEAKRGTALARLVHERAREMLTEALGGGRETIESCFELDIQPWS